jgi:hypothetical protein
MSTGEETLVGRLGRALAGLEEIRIAYLFGSRAGGGARADSDFDIAIRLDEPAAAGDRGAVVRRIAGALGREVASTLVDVVMLNDAPPLVRRRVLRDGLVLRQRSPEERVRFAVRTLRDYQDTCIQRERFVRARIRRLKAEAIDGGSRHLLEKARRAARLLAEASRVS